MVEMIVTDTNIKYRRMKKLDLLIKNTMVTNIY